MIFQDCRLGTGGTPSTCSRQTGLYRLLQVQKRDKDYKDYMDHMHTIASLSASNLDALR